MEVAAHVGEGGASVVAPQVGAEEALSLTHQA